MQRSYGNPGNFILAGFTLSLSCLAPCRTGQTTINTGCEPALLQNYVEHVADRSPLKNVTCLTTQ